MALQDGSEVNIPDFITCWVPFTDANPENGCLYCLPKD
eukprot:gene20172-1045_t